MRLDVGCGNRPTGDVNCDFNVVDAFGHRGLNGRVIDVYRVKNFVLCSGLFLPFRDGVFEEVFCAQLIEHLADPVLFLRELVRVSFRFVVVETVHRLGERFKSFGDKGETEWIRIHHISKFNARWFKRVCGVLGVVYSRDYVISWFCFPHDYFCLFRVPYGFGVELRK